MRSRHRATRASVAAATAALSLVAAGCGGGSPTTGATTTAPNAPLAFARCMRSQGLPNWPDPTSSGAFDKSRLRALGYSQSQVRAAARACPTVGIGPRETAQQQRTRLGAARAFARCMRPRGFPNFPDPTSQGELTPEMVTAAGIDLHQPQLLKAGLACVTVTHGVLTRAAIERAVNGG
jgi:hypothetical protein